VCSLQDKDGLISIENLKPLGPGIYQIDDFVVFAHPFFRRSLFRLNTLNYPLLKNLQALTSNSAKIALDPDMVGLATTYQGEREELAYWWGPKFNDDLTSIPTGVTHHEADETERIIHGISSTEFRWGVMKDYHVFEAEELCDVPASSSVEDEFGCRYVHSMVEEKRGHIEHLDGSIRMYPREAMLERLDTDLAHATRHTGYTKIWRVDGEIPISIWKRLISDYFRDNFLVGEYLGAEKLDKSIWSNEKEYSLQETFVPFSMTQDMGLRIALSIHARTFDINPQVRIVKPFDVISDGNASYPYVETFTLELRKALAKMGSDLIIPAGVRFVSHKDFYINLPIVYHPATDTKLSITQTLEAIKMLLNALSKKSDQWVVSYNIAFPLDTEREVRLSTLGQVNTLVAWLENPLSCPPVTNEELHEWSEKIASYLKETYPQSIDLPRIFTILMTSGILFIRRKRIEAQDFRFRYSEENKNFEYGLSFDENGQKLAGDLMAINVQPSLGYLIEESECEGCGKPYEECGCSKILDQDVAQIIKKALPFPFWTDRPLT
jgi:hypothetical protein